MSACIAKKGRWKRECQQLLSNPVLERSRKQSKDEMVLRLGDGKVVAAEAVGSLSLVSNLIMTAQHKCKVDNHENAQIWHARLGHISKDRIRRLVDSKNLEIDDLDHLPTCESCLKGKMTKKPFVGQSAIANCLLDLVHTDVCGPLSIPAREEFSYFITFTMITHVWLCLPDEVYRIFKETAGYYFYDPAEQKNFVSKNAVFLKKGFLSDSRRDEILIEESSEEPQHDSTTSFEPTVHTDGVPVLRRSTKESRVPERYGFMGLTNQLDNDPKSYGEAMTDIDSDK
ncbi:UNVERIFIED_CONTAM: hypothetical protein Slati_2237200 [Sesamum latifolium]|uniref:GAG-pre-integrase domain-containing protein n=1 Tax=Sesamum latifolium TaxID=2727402 RepID=A0AAW2WUJ9_9LAMI